MENFCCDNKKKRSNIRRKKELIFYLLMMIIPVIQVIIFYFVVNANSILLSLKEYTIFDDGKTDYIFVGFKNFSQGFKDLFNEYSLVSSFKNSFTAFVGQALVMPWLAMLFSYYIYKNRFGGKFFNVLLFLPSIISPLVITLIYKVMLEDAIPEAIFLFAGKEIMPIFSSHTLASLLFYYFFAGFGTSVLLYSGAMSGIDPSIIEAADIDGATGIRAFISIVFPLVYPTFVTFITVAAASIFTNQLHLHSFEGSQAEKAYYTYGYFLYVKTSGGTVADYPYLAALGIIFTFIAIPLTFGVKKLLNKFGPSID